MSAAEPVDKMCASSHRILYIDIKWGLFIDIFHNN